MDNQDFVFVKARKHFYLLMMSIGNPVGSKDVLKNLLTCYTEQTRYYHSLAHIVSMLDEFEEVSTLTDNPHAVRMAIWYHDAVQEFEASHISNEEKSAMLAERQLLNLGQDVNFVAKVSNLVRATGHEGCTNDIDTQILLDLDLAILGRSQEEFDAYENNIRKEYGHVDESLYRKERLKVLKKFLTRQMLYFTSFFRERYDKQARGNLERSIQKLSSCSVV